MPKASDKLVNEKALQAAQERATAIDEVTGHLNRQLAACIYAKKDQQTLETLRGDLAKAKDGINKEIAAREALALAYEQSTYQKQSEDPAVKAAKGALTKVRKDQKPVLQCKENLVNTVQVDCLTKKIDSIMNCDTPYYVKYGKGGGPTFKDCHIHTLASYSGWKDLIAQGVKTQSEVNVISAMSPNEGDLDSVQAYDSEILSLGAMQKTVNPRGTGELPIQLAEFRDDPATTAVFERELGSKGFSVSRPVVGKRKDGTSILGRQTLSFQDPQDPKAGAITGSALDTFVQTHRDRWQDTLGAFRALGRTPEFQRKQVVDFNARLISALGKTPKGYKHPITAFVTSAHAGAIVLDQDINRPGYVELDFGKALDQFYKTHPTISKEPSTWSPDDRSAWETQIVNNYAAVRRGTDMAARAAKLEKQGLSKSPGSLTFPASG